MNLMIALKPLKMDVFRFDEETAGSLLAVGRRYSGPLGGTVAIPVTFVDEAAVQVAIRRPGHLHHETAARPRRDQ